MRIASEYQDELFQVTIWLVEWGRNIFMLSRSNTLRQPRYGGSRRRTQIPWLATMNIKLAYWIAHHRGKFRLYIDTSTQTINKIVITDFFAQYYIFTPYIFSQCVKEKVLLFWSAYLLFCVDFNIDLVVICYCLCYYIAKNCFCNTTYHNAKETIDMSTNGQTDGHRQFRVLLSF